MLVLGIDPGTATTGFGLVRLELDGSLVAVKYGVILTPKEASAPVRLEMLYNELSDLLKEYHPDTAAVEKLFFSRNVTTALQGRCVVKRNEACIRNRSGDCDHRLWTCPARG